MARPTKSDVATGTTGSVGAVTLRSSGGSVLAVLVGLLVCGAAAQTVACGGSKDSGVASSKLPDGVRDEKLDHEACSESGRRVETLDANNDGKADVRSIYDSKTNKKVCQVSDLNHDGHPDLYEYFDANGDIRRREADYDANGTIDSIEDYSHGKITEKELDTTGQGRIDTWDFYDPNGTLVRRERDTTNDGRVDQWWTFDAQHMTIAFDKNSDGHPDPDSTIVLNLDGTAVDDTPDAAAPAAATNADGSTPVSTAPTLYDAGMPDDAGPVDAGKKKPVHAGKATKKK